MVSGPRIVSLITPGLHRDAAYAALTGRGYVTAVYGTLNDAVHTIHFRRSGVLVIDDVRDIIDWRTLLAAAEEANPGLRVVIAGASAYAADGLVIPRVHRFLRKPFDPAALMEAVESAWLAGRALEQRREPRLERDFPVEILYRSLVLPGRTRNINLYGMQAVLANGSMAAGLAAGRASGPEQAFTCRLFVWNDSVVPHPLTIPLELRYATRDAGADDHALLGFRFGDFPITRRLRLYQAIV